jgi:HEAT repeat protein
VVVAQLAEDVGAMRALFDQCEEQSVPSVLKSIALSLFRMRPTPETRYMATRLTESDDVEVRQFALRALWGMCSPASTEIFAAFIDDDDYRSRLWAIYGLARIRGPSAQESLLRATGSSDPRIRAEAIKQASLDEALRARLHELSDDPSRKVRRLARARLHEGA